MAAKKPSLSIIVPCYNEGKNISATVASINESIKAVKKFSASEILIFNDKSTDDTGEVADKLQKTNKNVTVIHNKRNMGFGYNYTEGVRQAVKDYILMVPGDNEIPAEAITNILRHVGSADLIIPYTVNPEVRPLPRRIVSQAFVALFNTLFGLSLKYYNGPCVIKGDLLKKVPMRTHGFAYMAAILVRLLKQGASFTEVPMRIQYRETGSSKAFAPRNVLSVLTSIIQLFWEVRLTERSSYKSKPRRVTSNENT